MASNPSCMENLPLNKSSDSPIDRSGFNIGTSNKEGTLEILEYDECLQLLKSSIIGRVGITINALPVILPVNYLYIKGRILFRTDPGTKLDAALMHCVVAFEVDGIDYEKEEGWSVLAIGHAEVVEDASLEREAIDRGMRPWSGGMKSHTISITPKLLSGRKIVHETSPASRL